ncbi:hypothetical protein NDU88_002273 [Pleurodeles waltl]|uniref:Uncharacterized protein n=1 Tax=Pleurodeles waltl TaxID=8319 RepID=A0AAV7NH72_PLEWA|nr:hypothetical protein NDU88_002273 [Pleurodeles waltl]
MTEGGAPRTGPERSVPAASLVRAAARLQDCCLTCAHCADRRLVDLLVDCQRESLEGGGSESSPALPPEACRHHVGSSRALGKGRASPVARKRQRECTAAFPCGRGALASVGARELR